MWIVKSARQALSFNPQLGSGDQRQMVKTEIVAPRHSCRRGIDLGLKTQGWHKMSLRDK